MGRVVAGVSRFGPVVRRYCLSVVYYLWEFSHPIDSRAKKVDLTTDASRRDLLGAVKPFVEEIEAALEDPECQGIERQGLQDFTATYEAVLELMGLPFEKVKANWDHFQLTADARLNRTLFHVFRGLDLYQMGNLELAEGHLLPGWERLLDIEKRRMLPMPLRQLVQNNQDIVARFERDIRQFRDTGESPGVQEFTGLPSIGHLLEEREMGRMQGLRHIEARPEPAPGGSPAEAKARTEGLVIDLGQSAEVPAAAPEGVFPEPSPAPPSPKPPAPPEPEAASGDGALSTHVGNNPFLDGVPGPAPSHPIGADGEPMEDSWEAMPTESGPPVGIESAPPVKDVDDSDADENPWADVSEERHVTADEFLATHTGEGQAAALFPEVAPAGPSEETAAPEEDLEESSANAHPSLAALFEGDDPADSIPPTPRDDCEPADDLERAAAETVPMDPVDPASTILRQHKGAAAKRAAEKARAEAPEPRKPARRHAELAELFPGPDASDDG